MWMLCGMDATHKQDRGRVARHAAAEMRLRCGELTAQEIRTVRAVLKQILQPNTPVSHGSAANNSKP